MTPATMSIAKIAFLALVVAGMYGGGKCGNVQRVPCYPTGKSCLFVDRQRHESRGNLSGSEGANKVFFAAHAECAGNFPGRKNLHEAQPNAEPAEIARQPVRRA